MQWHAAHPQHAPCAAGSAGPNPACRCGQRRARPRLPLRGCGAPGARTACGQHCARCHNRGRCRCGQATNCLPMHAHRLHWEGLVIACLDAHANPSLTAGDLPGQTLGGSLGAALVGSLTSAVARALRHRAACARRRRRAGGSPQAASWQCAWRGARCGQRSSISRPVLLQSMVSDL